MPEVHLPDGRVVHFPYDMPQEQIAAEVAKLAGGPTPPPAQAPERSWGDVAVDAIPTVAGAIGGVVGKMPVAGTLLSGLLGAGGEGYRQTIESLRGNVDKVPATMGGRLRAMGEAGLTQAGIEGGGRAVGGVLRTVAKPIYDLGLGASKRLRLQNPNLAKTGIDEGIAVSSRGTDKATRLRGQSAQKADAMIAQAEKGGASPVTTKEVMLGGGFKDVSGRAKQRAQLGMADDVPDVAKRAGTLKTKNPGGIPLTKAQAMKRTAQEAADSAFRAEERGMPIRTVDAQLDQATARGLRKGIETRVPDVQPVNQRTQALGGLTRALEDAETKNHMLSRLLFPAASGIVGGASSGDVSTGFGSALGAAALTAPGNLSRAAIGLDRAGKFQIPAHILRAAMLAQLAGADE